MAAKLPATVRLEGLDVSDAAFSPSAWLPSDISYRHFDVKSEVPEDLVGVYDIVHIRHFCLVLKPDDIPRVTENLVKLTKPGGYITWAEPGIASCRIVTAEPDMPTDDLEQLLRVTQGTDPRLVSSWVPKLQEHFIAADLREAEKDVRNGPLHLELAQVECNLVLSKLVTPASQKEGSARKLQRLLPVVEKQICEGACWAFTRYTVADRRLAGIVSLLTDHECSSNRPHFTLRNNRSADL